MGWNDKIVKMTGNMKQVAKTNSITANNKEQRVTLWQSIVPAINQHIMTG